MTAPPLRYRDLLYEWLPGMYRGRDDGTLQAFLAVLGDELDRVGDGIAQLHRDCFIDSCQDWVTPYLADLVGTDLLSPEAARNRRDVMNTIRARRAKGTLAGLEELAGDLTGWGVVATEMFERLLVTQRLDTIRTARTHAVDLRRGSDLARLETAFDRSRRSVDIRVPREAAGRHQPTRATLAFAPVPSHTWRGAHPARRDARRYHFHPLGTDLPLIAGRAGEGPEARSIETGSDLGVGRPEDFPIRTRDLRDSPLAYFGRPVGFTLFEDGIPIAATHDVGESQRTVAPDTFNALLPAGGLVLADPGLFTGAPVPFRVFLARLGAQTVVVNGVPTPRPFQFGQSFTSQLQLAGEAGSVVSDTGAYTHGEPFTPEAPRFHHPATVLGIEPVGGPGAFPECEVILRGGGGHALLAYLPAIPGLTVGTHSFLYIADDGSSYFARGDHSAGLPNLNPDAELFGAYLPGHLARAALGQARPRIGVRPVQFRAIVSRELCCWNRPPRPPLDPGLVAVDPMRGRVLFPAGEAPAGELVADFRFGRAAGIGAGPFDRGPLPAPTITVGQDRLADVGTVQEALDLLPTDRAVPVVVEIVDSATYTESLLVPAQHYPGGLVIQAATDALPVLRTGAATLLEVPPGARVGELRLDGLLLDGGRVDIRGDVPAVAVRFSTLWPESVELRVRPAAAGAHLTLDHVLGGAVTASAAVAGLDLRDSALVHPAATVAHPEAGLVVSAAGPATLERVTLVGELRAATLAASSCILYGPITLTDPAGACLRYSRVPDSFTGGHAYRSVTAAPVFGSLRPADPGCCQLHPNTAPTIRRGAEHGGEMGAFYEAGTPWREQGLRLRLAQHLPAGVRAVPLRRPPRLRFPGAIRL